MQLQEALWVGTWGWAEKQLPDRSALIKCNGGDKFLITFFYNNNPFKNKNAVKK